MLGHISFSIRFKSGSSAATTAALPVREMPTPAVPVAFPRAVGKQRSPGKGRGGPAGTRQRGGGGSHRGVRGGEVGGKGLPSPAGATQGRAGWRGRRRRVKRWGGEGPAVLKDEAGRGAKKYKLVGKAFRLGMERRIPAGPRQCMELERLRGNHGQTR